MKDKVAGVMASILDLSCADISDETSIDNIDSWDSLAHMNIMMALEQMFSIKIQIEQMTKMTSLKDIMSVLGALVN